MNTIETVILFVVDGMTPGAVRSARTPAMHALIERGAHTMSARSVMPSITLPAHMSIFHGVDPDKHQIYSNLWLPREGDPIPGLIDLLHSEKRAAVTFYTWEELRDLWRPGAVHHSGFVNIYGPYTHQSDAMIAEMAADYLARERVDFAFIYLGLTDEIGHRHGWGSAEYLAAVEGADAAIARVVDRLAQVGKLDATAVLVTADHGGHEKSHGSDAPEDMTVPWILAGPGVQKGCVLSAPVGIVDTAPTIARLLGLPLPSAWTGKPVLEALEDAAR